MWSTPRLAGQLLAYLGPRASAVTVGREQAARRGEQRALAVGIDRSPLEYELAAVAVHAYGKHLTFGEAHVDQIITVGGKLESPAVEAEVDGADSSVAVHGDRAVIARPCVVGGHLDQRDMLERTVGEGLAGLLGVGNEQQHLLAIAVSALMMRLYWSMASGSMSHQSVSSCGSESSTGPSSSHSAM